MEGLGENSTHYKIVYELINVSESQKKDILKQGIFNYALFLSYYQLPAWTLDPDSCVKEYKPYTHNFTSFPGNYGDYLCYL